MTTTQNPLDTDEITPPRIKSVQQWIWAAMLIISALIFANKVLLVQQIRSSTDWPTVRGTVELSDLEYTPLSRASQKYRLQFAYRYTVAGVSYDGRRISFDDKTSFVGRTSGERYVKRVLKQYPKDAAVTVHHHPRNHERAVLENEIPKGTVQTLVLGLGIALLSLTGWWRRWPLQTDYLFRPYDPDRPMTVQRIILGALGLASCLGIVWIWWELIKMYAGR